MPGNPGPGHSTYLASWGTSGICGSPRRFPQSHSSPPAWTAPGALCHTVRGRDEGERRVVLGIRHLLIPKNTGGWSPRNTSMQQCQVREETLSCPASELLQCLTVPLGCRGDGLDKHFDIRTQWSTSGRIQSVKHPTLHSPIEQSTQNSEGSNNQN